MEELVKLNQSQDVTRLQCKYTLFKRVINILTSATGENINYEVMEKAVNLLFARNDCLRIKFVKDGKEIKQIFQQEVPPVTIHRYTFNTQKEQDNFFVKYRKKAIKYMKGVVLEVNFINTYDHKNMILFKVCHMILDVYGINVIWKDLLDIYNALIENKELPPAPGNFEELVKKDLVKKENQEYIEKNKQFFSDYFQHHPTPYYTGLHGYDEPIWQKQLKKNKTTMKMFFINNQTDIAMHKIDGGLIKKALEYCKAHHCTISNLMFYLFVLTESRLNNNNNNCVHLELCNCRGTLAEKHTAGTKVQSLGVYISFDYNKSFEENLTSFLDEHMTFEKHIGYPDTEFEMLLNKAYKKPLLDTFYACTFSFIPHTDPKGIKIQIHSNGRFVLPAYVAMMYNIETNEINAVYEFQTKIINQEKIKRFNDKLVNILEQVINNPQVQMKDIK